MRAGGAIETELVTAIGKRRQELQGLMQQAAQDLAANFARWDQRDGDQNARAMLTMELKNILSRIAYLRTLIRDVDRGLESAGGRIVKRIVQAQRNIIRIWSVFSA